MRAHDHAPAFEDPNEHVEDALYVQITPAHLGKRGGVIPGYISSPEYQRLNAGECRELADRLLATADRLERWDAELLPVLQREAQINDMFLGEPA